MVNSAAIATVPVAHIMQRNPITLGHFTHRAGCRRNHELPGNRHSIVISFARIPNEDGKLDCGGKPLYGILQFLLATW